MTNDFALPVELRVGDHAVEVARLAIHPEPEVWRPNLAALLRRVADEIEQGDPDEQ